MPVRTVHPAYAQWLAMAPTANLMMTAIEFNWTRPGQAAQALYLGNHITSVTNVIYEDGRVAPLTPYQFELSQAERAGTTEARVNLQGPLPGDIFNQFQGLRGNQLAFRVVMFARYYLYPGGLGAPLSNVPEKYFVTSMTFGRLSLTMEAQMSRLPRFRAGLPYTVDEYPGLYEF